jgi:hypothetical protein
MDKSNTREASQVTSREWMEMIKWFGNIHAFIT